MNNSTRMLLSGNHAVAWGARLARPDVMPVYPITPQTPILEKLTEFHAQGDVKAEMLTPESEHSAMSACITASVTGSRVFTATSSQGLLLMHELLHYAAGARAPIVMANVNRTVASPWGFWPDQTDSLSQRDTGWVQFYSESPQESIDSVIQAFRIAEAVGLPVMVNHDAFYVSHAMEPVEVPSQALVDDFLPPYQASITLDTELGQSFGSPVDAVTYNRTRRELHAAMQEVYGVTEEVTSAWQDLTGRDYGILEEYRTENADTILVTLGSMAGTTREVIDTLRDQGQAIGMVKVRLFRPFPVLQLREALQNASTVMVLDRNFSPGMGGILHQELKAALSGVPEMPRIHGLLAGVGGVNVVPEKIQELVAQYSDAKPSVNSLWVE
jgi:pyruvate/2-oxoacid:ferredoxin oxidoreductase alpha subunit